MQEKLREKVSLALSLNPSIRSYCEPFCGGLGSFLSVQDILFEHGVTSIILNDINKNIINFYYDVKEYPYELIQKYFSLEAEFLNNIPADWKDTKKTTSKEEQKILLHDSNLFYKNVREQFNTSPIGVDKSAFLLFLQKHAFNGIYRENKKGGHNVPFNWNGDFVNKEETQNRILELSELLNTFNILLESKSFEAIEYRNDTLYYLDPPYLNDKGLENNYSKGGFNLDKQLELINMISHVPFVYSNHNSCTLIDAFKSIESESLTLETISRKNIVSSSLESRGEDKTEMLAFKPL
jgi:DNA adenine methylase